jgi:hypothetical protein
MLRSGSLVAKLQLRNALVFEVLLRSFGSRNARPDTENRSRRYQYFEAMRGALLDGVTHTLIPSGVPGGIRTPSLLIRSQMLYPVELLTLCAAELLPRHSRLPAAPGKAL